MGDLQQQEDAARKSLLQYLDSCMHQSELTATHRRSATQIILGLCEALAHKNDAQVQAVFNQHHSEEDALALAEEAREGAEHAKAVFEDLFGKPSFLTVSGQLSVENYCCSLSDVYTFGPTFRAENSNTARHAAEFWMIEPEMAFCDLAADMALAEENVRHLVRAMLEECGEELEFFNRLVDKGLEARLRQTLDKPFERLPYTDAVDLLLKSGRHFEHPVVWGEGLQTEHERYLAEEHVRGPVTIFNYPKAIKPFYMRQNEDGRTVAAMDLLVPGIGEIIGGSQREERLDVLLEAMRAHGLSEEDYGWYLDLRRYGSVPHAGYGMGFERLLMFVTGVGNIRDVIPFARTPGHAEY
jgi:asparaginyl-tRNA synthetase